MRVKLVSIIISAGAIASTVSIRMMTTLWFGLPFGFLLSAPPVRLPRSIEIDPLSPSAPVAPLAPAAPAASLAPVVGVVVGAVLGVVSGVLTDGGGGAVIVGALIGVIEGGVGAAAAGPEPTARDAMVPTSPNARTAPVRMRRRVPVRRARVLVVAVTVARRLGDAQLRTVFS